MDKHTHSPENNVLKGKVILLAIICFTFIVGTVIYEYRSLPLPTNNIHPVNEEDENNSLEHHCQSEHIEAIWVPVDQQGNLQHRPLFNDTDYGQALTTIFTLSFEDHLRREAFQNTDPHMVSVIGQPGNALFNFSSLENTMFTTQTCFPYFEIEIISPDSIPFSHIYPLR